MSYRTTLTQNTQNELLMKNLMKFYDTNEHLLKMMNIINGESKISLRIIDWFVTNYAKQNYTVYSLSNSEINTQYILTQESNDLANTIRFKVYNDYKLRLKAYSKERFDPFCRWERISIPYDKENYMETTIGQLNFFKWAIENRVIEFIEIHFSEIEADMNTRNSTSKRKELLDTTIDNTKTRKKREELSISACKCIKKENVKIIVKFGL
jgi:hypothetical protein